MFFTSNKNNSTSKPNILKYPKMNDAQMMNNKTNLLGLEIIELLSAYCEGFFPMADENNGEISWYSPNYRAIFPIYHLKNPKSLYKFQNKNLMKCTIDNNFEKVIRACSQRKETWISEEIIEMYCQLHITGFAHSIETWQDGKIVGGLYGVAIGGAFFGESMFNFASNASKVAFYYLVEHLKQRKFTLLDSQFINDFTAQLGAIEISREKYLKILDFSIKRKCSFL